MAYNNVTEVTNSDQISTTDRSASGPAPDGSPPTGNVPWGSVTDTPTSAAGYGIVNGAELDAFAGLGTTGFVTRTGSNAYATRTLTAGDNVTITNASGVAGNPTISVPSVPWADITGTPTTLAGYGIVDAQPLDSDLTAIAALTTTAYGRSFLTLADAAAARAYIGAGTSSFSGAFADLTGIPTTLAGYGIVDAQPLDGDLTAIAALSSTGYARRTGSNTWTLDSFVPASLGGTGFTSYASGDLLYGNGGGTLSKLAEPGFPGYVLSAVGGVPTWSQLSTLTATTITGTANQVLVNGTSGAAQTGPVTLTLPQSIATSSTPQFAQLGVGGAVVSTHAIAVHSSTADVVIGNNGVQAFFPALAGRGLFIQRNGVAGAHLFSAANTSTFVGIQTDGTLAAPTATTSGRGFNIAAGSFDGTNYFVNSRISLQSAQNQTASARGSVFLVATILNGSTTLADRFAVSATGSIECGVKAAAATNATDGFIYIPTCAGTPTGAPTAVTGLAPLIVDTTNNKLYFYSGGAWRDAGP